MLFNWTDSSDLFFLCYLILFYII